VEEKLISYMLETRGASHYILLQLTLNTENTADKHTLHGAAGLQKEMFMFLFKPLTPNDL
jgi:hypothetical protein